MSACVFAGPSLAGVDVSAILPDCRLLPPVQQGSIHEVVERYAPDVIGVVDGYFLHCPSVWHKEILWAMDRGVQVLGASSMGALRAAELAPFGMIGVGQVFEAYLAGALPPCRGVIGEVSDVVVDGVTDDDEVAMIHGPAESGYVAASDAMINIRFTLQAARAAGVIDEALARQCVREAKSLHFSERRYATVLERLSRQDGHGDALARLAEWLPQGKVDQKRVDGVALLERIAMIEREAISPDPHGFRFEMTELFHEALIAGPPGRRHAMAERNHHEAVVAEFRRNDKRRHGELRREVLAGMVILDGPSSIRPGPDEASSQELAARLRSSVDRFRQANGLWDRERIDAWLSANDLGIAEFEALLKAEARLDAVLESPDTKAVLAALIGRLKLEGLYPALSASVRQKQDRLDRKYDSEEG